MSAIPHGARVRLPAHNVAGTVQTMRGEPGARLVTVELPDGERLEVRESDIELAAAPPLPPAPQTPPASTTIPRRTMSIQLARVLARRLDGPGEYEQALRALALDYLELAGVKP